MCGVGCVAEFASVWVTDRVTWTRPPIQTYGLALSIGWLLGTILTSEF